MVFIKHSAVVDGMFVLVTDLMLPYNFPCLEAFGKVYHNSCLVKILGDEMGIHSLLSIENANV